MDRSARHGPNRLLNYLDIHGTVMRRFADDGLVEEDGLEFFSGANGQYVCDGAILLRERRLRITVTKVLETVDAADHRHQYDPFGPDRFKNEVTLIEDGDWPTLAHVIQEAEEWYLQNLRRVAALAAPFEV